MREFFKNGERAYGAAIKLGNLKADLRERVKDYDSEFGKFNECVVPKDAFDWNEIFDDSEHGKYNAVRMVSRWCCTVFIYLSIGLCIVLVHRSDPDSLRRSTFRFALSIWI